jgi:hypothetical protein
MTQDLGYTSHTVTTMGYLEVTGHYEAGGWILRLTKADPKVLVEHEIISNIAAGVTADWHGVSVRLEGSPAHCWLHCDCTGLKPCRCDSPDDCYHGMLLHVDALDRHIVYRITDYDMERHAWVAQWPD